MLPQVPFWPDLPQRSPEGCRVAQACGAYADVVRPRCTGSGYEVVPGQLAALLERLEQGQACRAPGRSAGFFACEQAVAAGMFVHASAWKGQRLGPLTLAWQRCTEDQDNGATKRDTPSALLGPLVLGNVVRGCAQRGRHRRHNCSCRAQAMVVRCTNY